MIVLPLFFILDFVFPSDAEDPSLKLVICCLEFVLVCDCDNGHGSAV